MRAHLFASRSISDFFVGVIAGSQLYCKVSGAETACLDSAGPRCAAAFTIRCTKNRKDLAPFIEAVSFSHLTSSTLQDVTDEGRVVSSTLPFTVSVITVFFLIDSSPAKMTHVAFEIVVYLLRSWSSDTGESLRMLRGQVPKLAVSLKSAGPFQDTRSKSLAFRL